MIAPSPRCDSPAVALNWRGATAMFAAIKDRASMHHRISKKLALAMLALAISASQQTSRAGEDGPKAFSCKFETGHSWTYAGSKFAEAPPAPLNFDISDINLDAQSARLLAGPNSTMTLRIVRALNANHFLEVATEGFLNLTTIYDADPATGAHPAVHSRHFGVMGQPIFAQYAGLCTPK